MDEREWMRMEDVLTTIKVDNYHMCEALASAGAAGNQISDFNCPSSSTTSTIIDIESIPLKLGLVPTSISIPSTSDEAYVSSTKIEPVDVVADAGVESSVGKRKRNSSKYLDELCVVCGDRATGYHYNALSCEGCKGFFRRSITKNAIYQCKYGHGCEIDMYMRRKCQECRLKKCLVVGMKPECVIPEYQCAVKRQVKKYRLDNTSSPWNEKIPRFTNVGFEDSIRNLVKRYGVTNLTAEQEELINRLVYFQDEFEQPTDEDLKRVAIAATPLCEDSSESRFRHITEMTILTVQLIVEFSKRLPGFDKLEREDQITLLKACSSEVMMLRTARRYDFQSDTIVFANNLPYTRDNYTMAGVGESADPLFDFCRRMCTKKVDNAEYALLTSIVIFSERPCLIDLKKVEKIQEIYLEALRAYVEYLDPIKPGIKFARLLNVLTELRTLGNINSRMCFSLKQKNKKLPPFLEEIWDVKV